MNRDDIIKMTREAGLYIATDRDWMPIIGFEYAEKFAALVAAHERQAIEQELLPLTGKAVRAAGLKSE